MRAIDHLVCPVSELSSARERLSALGFTVAPDAAHPFGTGNACVLFADRRYIEPLAVIDPEVARRAEDDGLVFVRRTRDFAARNGEGFAMLALASADAVADHAAFTAAGIASGDPFAFTRLARDPAGGSTEIGVRLAFAAVREAPDTTLFACERIATEPMFAEGLLKHRNGATGIAGVVLTAADPTAHVGFLSAVLGGAPEPRDGAVIWSGAGGTIAVLTPMAYRSRYGLSVTGEGLRLRLARITVPKLAAVRDMLKRGDILAIPGEGAVVVPPGPGLGAAIAFEAAS